MLVDCDAAIPCDLDCGLPTDAREPNCDELPFCQRRGRRQRIGWHRWRVRRQLGKSSGMPAVERLLADLQLADDLRPGPSQSHAAARPTRFAPR